jgi:hypothetical protein
MVADDAEVLPAVITGGRCEPGPRFGDDIWDVRGFVPRTTPLTRIDFTTIDDVDQRLTAKEYLYSRIRHGIPANQCSGTARPMKITGLVGEFHEIRSILADLARVGAPKLGEVTREHLDAVLGLWRDCPDTAAGLVGVIKHIAAHGAFLTDQLTVAPWPGRSANQVAGRLSTRENVTPRIPEHITAPLLNAALFYVEVASIDLLAARTEIAALEAARAGRRLGPGGAREALETFVELRRSAGRGLPAIPGAATRHHRGASLLNGVPQALNESLIGLLAGHGHLQSRGGIPSRSSARSG